MYVTEAVQGVFFNALDLMPWSIITNQMQFLKVQEVDKLDVKTRNVPKPSFIHSRSISHI